MNATARRKPPRASRDPIRVVLADDSPSVRHALLSTFATDPEIEVVAIAKDGIEAVEMVCRERPDLVTMDVAMPLLDGLEATRRIMQECPTPIVIISGMPGVSEAEVSFEALRAGAVDMITKPERVTMYADDARRRALLQHLKRMSRVAVVRRRSGPVQRDESSDETIKAKAIGIGASTGGPPVVLELLNGLRDDSPPAFVVQHMSQSFIGGFVGWLASSQARPVVVAEPGLVPRSGHVYVAPAGKHLSIGPGVRIRVDAGEPINYHLPSVDPLFESLGRYLGSQAAGFLLTGMGRDGAEGLAKLRKAGGVTCAQSESSCTIFGMPRVAIELGAAKHVEDVAGLRKIISSIHESR